ncbi:hypothetical protein EJK55_2083 [Moraxella catarrhalis]|uniref:Uncharacterized protein n=1 Tax=Moraxella catarrhalis TaxID=480 RepID=A0A3S9QI41_MORCA|nr:hypothetical protein MCR_1231 [Moraxella catarrhalis BBH18]AZQ90086.1 hypothetical protein EJK50_1342 [Moraxella catarrhalis]EKF83192.1 hypothetical protein MCRH_1300 [Moraxella catarrhalis RH4]AZQ94213.1 hypothetical protein EJK53_1355 [Moraxella catarrhalis]AZQ96000.1 hypothetical protein EJK48_1366 [Moraxella catarrhalis]
MKRMAVRQGLNQLQSAKIYHNKKNPYNQETVRKIIDLPTHYLMGLT